ncbi:hypothetical protein Esti_000237 [Eimeria stiedai]
MGATESALVGSDGQRHPPKGITCIAAAAETRQTTLHIPLLCGATTSVEFSTVLGEGSYGVVYGGCVDRSTCKQCPEGEHRGINMSFEDLREQSIGDSRQSSLSFRQGCQYCFSDRTRQVAVKALRHSSQRQQRFFINRFKFLQLIRLQQLLVRNQDPLGAPQEAQIAELESATTVSSREDDCQGGAVRTPADSDQAADGTDKATSDAVNALGGEAGKGEAGAAVGDMVQEGHSCGCCKFLQFPSFDSLHLLQVFGVYTCSKVSKEFLVMEKLSGPTLFGYLCSRYSEVLPKEWEACQIVVPILKGLSCIHEEGFIHGDIKLENIMFRSVVPHPSTLTLVDLDGLTPLPCAAAKAARAYSVAAAAAARHQAGSRTNRTGPVTPSTAAAAAAAAACNTSLSSLLNGEQNTLEGLCCTPQYLPLEVVKERKLSPFADLHAVGCICYLLMEGCFPHERINLKSQGILSSGHICQKLSRDVRYPRVKQKYSPLCENFMRKLLSSDPHYRFSSASNALRHPWIEYARSLQTPEEVQRERELLRSVLTAAEEAAEKAVEAADKAEEAAKKQMEAEAAAAAAAAAAAEAAALEAEAARRAAQEAALAADAAAKKSRAEDKARQAAAAAAAARAERAKAEQAAEESAAAVVALAQCQEAGDLENADQELEALLSPRAAAARHYMEGSAFASSRSSGCRVTESPRRPRGPTSGGASGVPSGSAVLSNTGPKGEVLKQNSPVGLQTASDRTNGMIERDDSFYRGAARFIAAARSPRTPRRRNGSLPRATESAAGGLGGSAANGSTADSSAFVLLDQQHRAFAKGGAAAAAARPSITGPVRAMRGAAQQQAKPLRPLGSSVLCTPRAAACLESRDHQAAGGQRLSPAVADPHNVPRFAHPLPLPERCGHAAGPLQPPYRGAAVGGHLDASYRETDRQQANPRANSRMEPHPHENKEGSAPPSWYNGIVSFLEVVSSQSPRGPVRLA